MKIGDITKLDDVTFTSSVEATSGFPESNILDDDTLAVWQVEEGTVTLTLEFDSISAQNIGLFNLTIEDDVTIKTFNSTLAETNSVTVNVDDLYGIDNKHAFIDLSDTADIVKIQIITNGATSTFDTSLGYIWVGDMFDFGELEEFIPIDNGTEDATITRANSLGRQSRYNSQRLKFTTNKKTLISTLQDNVRGILATGFTTKRPFYMNECFYQNAFLGIFENGAFQYDKFILSDVTELYAQITKSVAEVF